MGIEGVELLWLDLHLKVAHRTSYGVDVERPVILARVVTGEGEGWGECSAFARPTYSEEYAEGVWEVLRRELVPRVLGTDGGGVAAAMAPVQGNRMAKACLEMAVTDAGLRAAGRSLAESLGVTAGEVEAGAVIGTREDLGEVVDEVEALVGAGYRRVKAKIKPGWDLEPLRVLRSRFPELGLQADANGAYTLADADRLTGLDELELLCLEQPLPADDLVGHGTLARRLRTPVCLDESITSLGRLEEALALEACDVVCVKAGRLGGLRAAVAVHDRCLAAGIPVWCGGMLETGLARAANAALAGLPGFSLAGDLGGGDRFVEGDPAGVLVVTAGRVPVFAGPGVGPAPRGEALGRVGTRREWFPAR